MSNAEGDKPDFDELELPAGDVPESGEEWLEPLSAEGVPPDEPAETLEPLEPVGQPAEGGPEALEPMPVAAGGDVLEPVDEEPEKEEERPKGLGLLARLVPTPYVALLGIAVLAIVIANLCLLLELGRYGGKIKPPEAGAASTAQ